MGKIFLIGGGWKNQEQTFGRFVKAATVDDHRRIALILLEEEDESYREEANAKYRSTFSAQGVTQQQLEIIWISHEKPLVAEKLREYSPTGVFVGGGTTPLYQEVLCKDRSWVEYVRSGKITYGGFSAGAAIAARNAVVGGWKIKLNDREISVVDEECSEELEWLTVTEGLGLVPFAVEVHASQWGNLARLVHAVDQQQVISGWAIDEDTLMQVDGNQIQVWGSGQVYLVQRTGKGEVQLGILRAGDRYRL